MKTGPENPKGWEPPSDAVETTTAEQEWTPPSDAVEVKKKDVITGAPNSEDGTTAPGGIESSQPLAQGPKPLPKPTLLESFEANLKKTDSQRALERFKPPSWDEIRARNNAGVFPEEREKNIVVTGSKSGWNTLAYQLPSAITAGMAAVTKPSMDRPSAEAMFPDFKKPIVTSEEIAANTKKNLINWAIERSAKGEETVKNLTSSLDKIKDPIDALNWVSYALGQAAGQIPASVLSGGATSIGQEVGSIYMDGVKKIAQDEGITPSEVIDKNLDKPALAIAYGTAAGLLDYVGAKNVMSFGKRSLISSLRRRATDMIKTGSIEAGTEYAQTWMEQIGASQVAGKDLGKAWNEANTNDKALERLESMAQGAVGGIGLHAIGSRTSDKLAKLPTATPTEKSATLAQANKVVSQATAGATTENADQVAKKVEDQLNTKNDAGTNESRLASKIGERAEPIQTESIKGSGNAPTQNSGMVSGPSGNREESSGQKQEIKSPSNIPLTEVTGNRPLTHSEFFSNLSSTPSLLEKGYSQLDVPSRLNVLSHVLGGINNDKIFRAIVPFVPIDVVNNFSGKKFTTNDLLHNKSVLINALSSKRSSDIVAPIVDAIVRGSAILATENSTSTTAGRTKESNTTLGTENADVSEIPSVTHKENASHKNKEVQADEQINQPKEGEQSRTEPLEAQQEPIDQTKTMTAPASTTETSTSPEKVFVYGTLQDQATRRQALGIEGDVPVEPATARGTITNENKYPDFHPEGEHQVQGHVLTLTPEQIEKLDHWEEKYNRKEITLENGEKAWVYEEKPAEEIKNALKDLFKRDIPKEHLNTMVEMPSTTSPGETVKVKAYQARTALKNKYSALEKVVNCIL